MEYYLTLDLEIDVSGLVAGGLLIFLRRWLTGDA